jgi:hypothetical protein
MVFSSFCKAAVSSFDLRFLSGESVPFVCGEVAVEISECIEEAEEVTVSFSP